MKKSKCCKAQVDLMGTPDFIGEGEEHVCTQYYVCMKCGNDCDIISVPEKVIKVSKEGKIFHSVEEVKAHLNSKRKWYNYPRLWFHWYFWNYVSSIPLEIKSFIQRGIRGYSDRDTWDFDNYLTNVIEGGIERLINHNIRDDKTYVSDLKIIVKTMQLSREMHELPNGYNRYMNKKVWNKAVKEFEKGMTILAKRWFSLWD